MLPNFLPQFSPQGLFSGVPGAGLPYISPALFGQPGAYGFNGSLAYPPSPGVVAQPPYLSLGATNPFFFQTPFMQNPLLSSFIGTAGIGTAGTHPAQQIMLLLGQLSQQFSVQGAVNQQIAYALQHLAQQLISYQQLVQGQPFMGAGQAFGLGAPFLPNVFAGVPQGGYGFSPQFSPQQAQAWGASRPQTIQ